MIQVEFPIKSLNTCCAQNLKSLPPLFINVSLICASVTHFFRIQLNEWLVLPHSYLHSPEPGPSCEGQRRILVLSYAIMTPQTLLYDSKAIFLNVAPRNKIWWFWIMIEIDGSYDVLRRFGNISVIQRQRIMIEGERESTKSCHTTLCFRNIIIWQFQLHDDIVWIIPNVVWNIYVWNSYKKITNS